MQPGYVYVLSDGTPDYYKIGKTVRSVQKRIKQLQTGNKNVITIVYYDLFADMDKAEKSLHKIFSAYRRKGEWFRLDRQSRELLGRIYKDPIYPQKPEELEMLIKFGLR